MVNTDKLLIGLSIAFIIIGIALLITVGVLNNIATVNIPSWALTLMNALGAVLLVAGVVIGIVELVRYAKSSKKVEVQK